MCNEVIDGEVKQLTKRVPTNFNQKKITCKTQIAILLLAFFKISIALLIAVSIYCYQIQIKNE